MTAAPEFSVDQAPNQKSRQSGKARANVASSANNPGKKSLMETEQPLPNGLSNDQLWASEHQAAAVQLQAVARGRSGRGEAAARRAAAVRKEQLRKQALMRECRSRGFQTARQHAADRQAGAAARLQALARGRNVRGAVALRLRESDVGVPPIAVCTDPDQLLASLPVRGPPSVSDGRSGDRSTDLPGRRKVSSRDSAAGPQRIVTKAADLGRTKSNRSIQCQSKASSKPNTAKHNPDAGRRAKQATPKGSTKAPLRRESFESCSPRLQQQLSGARGPLTGKLLNKASPSRTRESSPIGIEKSAKMAAPQSGARGECSLPRIHQPGMNAGSVGGARGTRPAVKTPTNRCSLPSLANRGVAS